LVALRKRNYDYVRNLSLIIHTLQRKMKEEDATREANRDYNVKVIWGTC
jgi:hypothetical protein